ncbi:glycosyltransferase family 4 protein [Halobacterium wangiae]|uniref:glycosyltransferase family 4 protein n=1 Tax=Halobacterium wangiae TaxID=2902623 RepID=UPI001E3A6B4D|nr:glycosyltransferase family 4 protein [Halobacterium wangiae]
MYETTPMTHITIVTQPVGPIGEAQTRSLLNIMAEIGEVSLISGPIDDPDLKQYQTQQYTESRTGKGAIPDAVDFVRNQIALSTLVRNVDTDILWFNGMQLYTLPIWIAKSTDVPVVVQPKGDVPLALYLNWDIPESVRRTLFRVLRRVEHIGYSLADFTVFYSPSMAEEYGIDNAITNGMRYISDDFGYDTHFEDRDPKIGFLGRHNADKNIKTIVEIAKSVDYEFHFAGTGPMLDWVRNQTSKDDSINIHGWVEDPEEFLNEMRLLVYPSSPIEGLPTTIMEAHACGTPTITTAVSGNPDIVIDGETGYLIDEASAEKFVDKIESAEFDELRKMSANCREMAAEQFTKEAAVERYEAIIRTVTGGSTP